MGLKRSRQFMATFIVLKKEKKGVNYMKKLAIMAGLPGSGKSTIRKQLYTDLYCVDCDQIKERIPGYDPRNPGNVHALSKVMEKEEIYTCLSRGVSFVYDTTASNQKRIEKMIQEAKDLNYIVEICYVKVELDVALKRNQNRERIVPPEIIIEKHSVLEKSIECFSALADKVRIYDNNKELS